MKDTAFMRIAALLLLLLLGSAPLHAETWGLEQLMQSLAQNKGGKASFVETTYMRILDMPLVSSGELVFIAPDHLEKRTLKPAVEIMVLDGDNLTIERDQHKNSMKLSDFPEVAAFIESIRGTLAGDLKALQQQYHMRLRGTQQHWKLTLVPINTRMAIILQRITIEGDGNVVRSVEFLQAGGDRSTMTITNAANL